MKGIYAFSAGVASAIGLAWLYENNADFRQSIDGVRDRFRGGTTSATKEFREAARSAGNKHSTSAEADAARRAVFTRASARTKTRQGRFAQDATSGGIDLNSCSRENLIGAGLSEDLAERILENRPYRSKLDLVARLVIPQDAYESIKHSVTVDDGASDEPIKVAH